MTYSIYLISRRFLTNKTILELFQFGENVNNKLKNYNTGKYKHSKYFRYSKMQRYFR